MAMADAEETTAPESIPASAPESDSEGAPENPAEPEV